MILKTPVPDVNPRVSPVVFQRPKSLMAGTGLAINVYDLDFMGRAR
jgi:hypothetical protein